MTIQSLTIRTTIPNAQTTLTNENHMLLGIIISVPKTSSSLYRTTGRRSFSRWVNRGTTLLQVEKLHPSNLKLPIVTPATLKGCKSMSKRDKRTAFSSPHWRLATSNPTNEWTYGVLFVVGVTLEIILCRCCYRCFVPRCNVRGTDEETIHA